MTQLMQNLGKKNMAAISIYVTTLSANQRFKLPNMTSHRGRNSVLAFVHVIHV